VGVALAAASGPTVRTDRGCYFVHQKVGVKGAGFAPSRLVDVAIDGVSLGQNTTSSAGAFSEGILPGGLDAGQTQHVYHLDASDGTVSAAATFTLTRPPGGRFLATSGNPHTLRAPFEVWGFALNGRSRTVYLHYVNGAGKSPRTISLGPTGGQCGYLKTGSRKLFPFPPTAGRWLLQLDTVRSFSFTPAGPLARITVHIS
jgi:hypothetical protein